MAIAQNAIPISRKDIVAKAIKDNPNRLLADNEVTMAAADLNKANASIYPDVNLSYTGISTNNALMAFGSRLNQERITQADFNPALLNDPAIIQNFTTRIEVRQPILNMDVKYYRQAAKTKLAAKELQAGRSIADITFQVDQTYLNLQLAYKQISVLEKAKIAAQENLSVAENRFKQGYLQKSDLLAVQLRLNDIDNQLLTASNNIRDLSDQLLLLMNDAPGTLYVPSDSLETPVLPSLAEDIPEDRADFKAMRLASEAYLLQNEAHKRSHLPRLNAWASYEIHDNSPLTLEGEGYLVGLQLTWNITGKKKNNGQFQKSRAEYEQSRIQYDQYLAFNKVELEKALRQLDNARNNITLSEQAIVQSDESLKIRKNRYNQGLELTNDLLLAESQFAERQLNYYAAIFQYNLAIAYINYLTTK
jgi:outer membrane protein TolC